MNLQGIAYHRAAAKLLREPASALVPKIFGDESLDRHAKGDAATSNAFSAARAERSHGRLLAQVRALEGHDDIAARLAACAETNPCLHALCPKCERLIGRWLAWTVPNAVRKILKARVNVQNRDWSSYCRTVTIAAIRMRVADIKFSREIYAGIFDRLHEALRAAGITMAIGGVELVGMRDAATLGDLEFVVKLRVIVFYGESEEPGQIPTKSNFSPVRSALKEAFWHRFSRKAGGRRLQTVLRGKRWTDDNDVLARVMHSNLKIEEVAWGRRKPNGSRAPARYHSRSYFSDELEALLALTSRFTVTDRLFLHGVTITTNERGRMVLRPLQETLQHRAEDPIGCRMHRAPKRGAELNFDFFAGLEL